MRSVRMRAQEFRADGVGRGDDDVAGRGVAVELDGLRQPRTPASRQARGHCGDGGVEQGGDAVLVEQGERFLGLAERVAEEDRDFAVGEGVLDEAQDRAFDLHAAGER